MKLRLLVAASLMISDIALAQAIVINNNNAGQFALQAGVIAGTAQACGQNVTVFNAHVAEAISALTMNPTERSEAMLTYQKALSQAQINQQRAQAMPCSQIVTSFNNLPLMRSDYKEKVLPELTKLQSSPMAMPTMALPATGANSVSPYANNNVNNPPPVNNVNNAPNPPANNNNVPPPAENKVAVVGG